VVTVTVTKAAPSATSGRPAPSTIKSSAARTGRIAPPASRPAPRPSATSSGTVGH
jgi:hypothetical protein